MTSSSKSGNCTPPPVSVLDESSPVGKVPPYFLQHKREQVQAFDKNVQQLDPFTEEQFLNYLNVKDTLIPSGITHPPQSFSIDGFCSLANDIARSIKSTHFHNYDLLVFKDTGNKIPIGHVTGTKCRPDITAAFQKDWTTNGSANWPIIRLVGERASSGEDSNSQKKRAATYLHYLLLARPDFLVAQGLLTTQTGIMFLVGIGGVGIRQLTVNWGDKSLYKLLYVSIYRLYDPSHFADTSYKKVSLNEETSEVTYNVDFKTEHPGFRAIYARNPFTTRTHVLSNPSQGDITVIKELLCLAGRRFDEWKILNKIHHPAKVPGVVEAVYHEVIPTLLSPEREKHRLGLRETGSAFTSIPTAKKVLETLFDLLEVLRFLRFERGILHRDISVGNVMYFEDQQIPTGRSVEPLFFAKYLLGDSKIPQETSLLLVDFNLGEDLKDNRNGGRMARTGTPIFISRAVEQGRPVPVDMCRTPPVPTIPECYAKFHPDRFKDIPEQIGEVVDPINHPPDGDKWRWRHELDHDVESVFWLLLYWAMVAQPEGASGEYLHAPTWTSLLGDFTDRERLVIVLRSGSMPKQLTHSVYGPLWPLIRSLAAILVVDRYWIPESSVRKRPDYICEAFQRLILEFIVLNRDEDFMTCRVGETLRQVEEVAQSQAPSASPSQQRDASVRYHKRRRLDDGDGGESSNERMRSAR